VWVDSFTFSYTLENIKCDSQASLLAHTFVNPCFGRKFKAKVTIVVDEPKVCLYEDFISTGRPVTTKSYVSPKDGLTKAFQVKVTQYHPNPIPPIPIGHVDGITRRI
jgi:hypothetical protein